MKRKAFPRQAGPVRVRVSRQPSRSRGVRPPDRVYALPGGGGANCGRTISAISSGNAMQTLSL